MGIALPLSAHCRHDRPARTIDHQMAGAHHRERRLFSDLCVLFAPRWKLETIVGEKQIRVGSSAALLRLRHAR